MGLQSGAWLARVPCFSSTWSFIPLHAHFIMVLGFQAQQKRASPSTHAPFRFLLVISLLLTEVNPVLQLGVRVGRDCPRAWTEEGRLRGHFGFLPQLVRNLGNLKPQSARTNVQALECASIWLPQLPLSSCAGVRLSEISNKHLTLLGSYASGVGHLDGWSLEWEGGRFGCEVVAQSRGEGAGEAVRNFFHLYCSLYWLCPSALNSVGWIFL